MPTPDQDNQLRELVAHLQTIARPGVNLAAIPDGANLFEVGALDSLALVEIIMFLEQRHNIDFRRLAVDPKSLTSVREIMHLIARDAG